MKKSDLEIKIGMEVESNEISSRSAPADFKAALGTACWSYSDFNDRRDGTRSSFQALPEKFRPPLGWRKDQDGSCGLECKFSEPTTDVQKAEGRIEALVEWFKNVGIDSFRNSGTHIHLGTFDWIAEHIGAIDGTLGSRARALLFGYFVTRERAIFDLVPRHRRSNDYCPMAINPKTTFKNIQDTPITRSTPLWAIHNALLAADANRDRGYGFGSGAIYNMRHIPTFEFRMFPGTNKVNALKGYLRLIHTMFLNVAPLMLEDGALRSANEAKKVFIANPFTFTAKDLRSEFSDPWLKSWIDETLENDGNPINTNITSCSGPERLVTV